MKQVAKIALCGVYKYSGAMYAQEMVRHLAGRSYAVVLLFHRVTDAIPEDGLTVGTAHFRAICKMLARSFNVIPLSEIIDSLKHNAPLPRRAVAITFDDCYRDNLFASHILADHKLPATFFVPTAYVGTDTVFEWDLNLPRMANLTWDDIKEMCALGFEIGSHSKTHPNFQKLSKSQALMELTDSKKTLEDKLGRSIRWFAYPFGGKTHFPVSHLAAVHEAGYDGCMSGYGGFIYPQSEQGIIPREPVPYFRSVLNLELHLTGCLQWLYSARRRAGML